MVMLFDHEEVGSTSAQGADSNMAAEITQRIYEGLGE
jgi:aspartyl aminopeptidase